MNKKITKKAKSVIVIHEEYYQLTEVTEYECPSCMITYRGYPKIDEITKQFYCECGQLLTVQLHKVIPRKNPDRVYQDGSSKQVVVCAACKLADGTILCGARHLDSIMHGQIKAIYGENCKPPSPIEQGFIDQYGEFLTREDALEIAKKTKQIIRGCGGDSKKLFSENLY